MAAQTQVKEPKRRRRHEPQGLHKPRGVLHPRVKQVGPEHFALICVDCAKAQSIWMLSDFYGTVLIPPTQLPHTAGHFSMAILQIRAALEKHGIQDQIVAIERTGNYHLPVKRAFADAGYECRIVHPFATKQFRQPATPGNKTDETDLAAIFRATTNGLGLIEQELDPLSHQLRLIERHRRDLVYKRSAVCCQLREHLAMVLPGYTACFTDLWESEVALPIARLFNNAHAIRETGVVGLAVMLKRAGVRCLTPTLEKIIAWARTAPAADVQAVVHHRILLELDEDRSEKSRQITALEQDLVRLLVQTPYVLLLSIPGINVISAAELGGELGPMEHYAGPRNITGRTGLFPARYQSDRVDLHGHLVRCANRSLRAALLQVADNLRKCNPHFRALADLWKATKQEDAERIRIKIASRFSRIAYHMVAGHEVFHHPGLPQRDYILDKLLKFHHDHQLPPDETLANLQQAVAQLPHGEHPVEAVPLCKRLLELRAGRRRGPQPLKDVLTLVLAKLGVGTLQSTTSGDQDPS